MSFIVCQGPFTFYAKCRNNEQTKKTLIHDARKQMLCLRTKARGKTSLLKKKMRPYVSLIKDQSVAMLEKDRLLFEDELKKNEEMATEQWRNEEAKMKDRERRLHRTRRHTATIKYSK